MDRADIVVVGAGPAGLAAALALGRSGARVCLIGAAPGQTTDTRTAALFPSSIALLRNLGAFDALAAVSTPLLGIRIVDDTGGLLRAPEVTFEAHELGLDAFGYNVPNASLVTSLDAAVAAMPNVHRLDGNVMRVDYAASQAVVQLHDGRAIAAPLVIGADGRTSICRESAGIAANAWAYPQTAIATQFDHTRPHHGFSTEFHRSAGPCTTVPMPGLASSLVWVERPAIATRLLALDDAAFARALEERLHGLLGTVKSPSVRRAFALSGLAAARMGQRRIALAGEAAHVLPPIGAQGLNLGLRDAATIAELVEDARTRGLDWGADDVLAAYDRARGTDVAIRTNAVDLLNRSLLMDSGPVHLARGFGLHMIASVGALKRLAMTKGMEPDGQLPRLMRA